MLKLVEYWSRKWKPIGVEPINYRRRRRWLLVLGRPVWRVMEWEFHLLLFQLIGFNLSL